jgi:hypothetical protein
MMNDIQEERVKALAIGFTEYAQEHGYSEPEACFASLVLAAGIAPVAMKKEVMRFFADCLDGSYDIKTRG